MPTKLLLKHLFLLAYSICSIIAISGIQASQRAFLRSILSRSIYRNCLDWVCLTIFWDFWARILRLEQRCQGPSEASTCLYNQEKAKFEVDRISPLDTWLRIRPTWTHDFLFGTGINKFSYWVHEIIGGTLRMVCAMFSALFRICWFVDSQMNEEIKNSMKFGQSLESVQKKDHFAIAGTST